MLVAARSMSLPPLDMSCPAPLTVLHPLSTLSEKQIKQATTVVIIFFMISPF